MAASPQFQTPDARSPTPVHRRPDGRFFNPWPTGEEHGGTDVLKWAIERRRDRRGDTQPPKEGLPFPLASPAFDAPRAESAALTVTWVGHSSFLLQIGALNILTDPMWSERASPVPFAGPRRWMPPGIPFESLPPIDLVLQSHNHYDHLDEPTVRRLAERHGSAQWIAPLGVGSWLRERGATVIAELDWWESVHMPEASVMAVPAQHFSARGPFDRDRTLWCSYVLTSDARGESARRVFFAGDTGYHPEFGLIGERSGPLDLALLPVGAYDPRWFMRPVHMDPEEAVQAYRDLTAPWPDAPTSMVPMHWGTFRLTDEPMDEPPIRTRAAWKAAGLPEERLWMLAHGETRRE